MKKSHNKTKLADKKLTEYAETMVDFWSWAFTESLFALTPYVLGFVIIGWIFS